MITKTTIDAYIIDRKITQFIRDMEKNNFDEESIEFLNDFLKLETPERKKRLLQLESELHELQKTNVFRKSLSDTYHQILKQKQREAEKLVSIATKFTLDQIIKEIDN